MGSSSSNLALVAGSELSEVAVVVSLPVVGGQSRHVARSGRMRVGVRNLHLVVEDLGLAGLGLGNQGLVKDVENILADLLELGLNLLAVVADDTDVLIRALGLLLLLDGGDDAPRGTAGTDNVLVRNGKQITLINGELATDLKENVSQECDAGRRPSGVRTLATSYSTVSTGVPMINNTRHY